MDSYYIHHATIVNENKVFKGDVLLQDGRISRIMGEHSKVEDVELAPDTRFVEADGCYLMPGGIDEHVHFRDPGLTHKGDFLTESRAAVAGGITSVLDMPNTLPQTTTRALWEQKAQSAEGRMYTNYAFYLGATNHNFSEILAADPQKVAGVKLFLGSSTGDMLLSDEQTLDRLFQWKGMPFLAHCEEETIIRNNTEKAKKQYGETAPFRIHAGIRSEEACYLSSQKAVERARKYRAPLHILHVSTRKELSLLSEAYPEITMEACPSYLFFSEKDYDRFGCRIKCNPSIKTEDDRQAILEALQDGRIRCVGSDHAPHTWSEKDQDYFHSPSGMPMVQHSLLLLMELVHEGKLRLTRIPELLSHHPAELLKIKNKGFIQEGYDADLVLVDPFQNTLVETDNTYYACAWSPLSGRTFHSRIRTTFVNGRIVYNQGHFSSKAEGSPLCFDR